ncbi:MAG: STAS domain-containing protein [Chloroflexota bacterium]|nr:STAS domain-containing protein [Chloroflexota bacterium]
MRHDNPLEATVRNLAGIAVVELRGEINAAAEDTLQAAYADAEGESGGAILLDFGAVEYINSTGIALIVGLLARARAAQNRLAVCGLSDHYREIFAITRLADFMPVYPDVAVAVADLTSDARPGQTN